MVHPKYPAPTVQRTPISASTMPDPSPDGFFQLPVWMTAPMIKMTRAVTLSSIFVRSCDLAAVPDGMPTAQSMNPGSAAAAAITTPAMFAATAAL